MSFQGDIIRGTEKATALPRRRGGGKGAGHVILGEKKNVSKRVVREKSWIIPNNIRKAEVGRAHLVFVTKQKGKVLILLRRMGLLRFN